MCHLVLVLKPMRNFELEFYDRLQYWHRLQEKVVRIMKKSVRSECRVQNFELSGGKQGTWYVLVYPCPSPRILVYPWCRASLIHTDLPPKKKVEEFFRLQRCRVISAREDEILIDSQPILHPHNYACKGDKGNFNKSSSFSFEIPLF